MRPLKKPTRNAMIVSVVLSVLDAYSAVLHAQAAKCTVWDGLYSAEQAARGKALYDEKCALCHGADLSGREMAPALAGSTFIDEWANQSVGDLAERIHRSMPMNDPGSLRNRQVADLVAYVLATNEFPAGQLELAAEPMLLQQIEIAPEKPAQSVCPLITQH
jgi:S-disulfanyl-L-cysteine oxidoreductase SoxD